MVATAYQGPAVESLWWKSYENPCELEGNLFRKIKDLSKGLPIVQARDGTKNGEEAYADKAVRKIANSYIRPRWQKHISRILTREKDIDAIIIFTVPLNHFGGLPTFIREKHSIPVIYYDGDVPASLPTFQGFQSGFKIYQGADITEYDAFISNSKGGAAELEKLGAKNVCTIYWGADPDLFSPLNCEQDIDVFFYGHGHEYRQDWIDSMITEPSKKLSNHRFAIRGTGFDIDLGETERLPYASVSKLREYCCRSKINLNITRKAHASVYASSSARIFELASMGCCIVSNPVEGLEEWFEVGKELIIVNGVDEVVERYKWLLSHDRERQCIGKHARECVLKRHAYRDRATQLIGIVNSLLKQ